MANDDPLEARVIARVQDGDAEAYDTLVSKYLPRVVAIAWGVVRNAHDAEDLAQEAFVRAYQNIGRFRLSEALERTSDPFGPWIGRIVLNLALDVLKHRRKFRHEELAGAEPAARRDDADVMAVSNDIGTRIDAAIEELPEMQRLVARLHLVEEMEHAEIADLTGLSEGTVRSHLSHARAKLKEKLADLYD